MTSDGIHRFVPDHTVTLGETAKGGSGDRGRHEDTRVVIDMAGVMDTATPLAADDAETHTFRSAVEVSPSPDGDTVVVDAVPSQIRVELTGGIVGLDGDRIASGAYSWIGHERRQAGHARRVTLRQIVPCPTCESVLDEKSEPTAVGRVCGRCAREFKNSDHGGGDHP